MEITIDDKIFKDISDYCEFNKISDVVTEINRILKVGFNIEKYGNIPFSKFKQVQEVQIEPVVEKVEVVKKETKRKTKKTETEEEPKIIETEIIEPKVVEQIEEIVKPIEKPKRKVRIIKS